MREAVLLSDRGANFLELCNDKGVVCVASGVEAGERGETLLLTADLDEPSGRLREDPDQAGEGDRRDNLQGEGEAPLEDGAVVVDLEAVNDETGDEGSETKGELLEGRQATADRRVGDLRLIKWSEER